MSLLHRWCMTSGGISSRSSGLWRDAIDRVDRKLIFNQNVPAERSRIETSGSVCPVLSGQSIGLAKPLAPYIRRTTCAKAFTVSNRPSATRLLIQGWAVSFLEAVRQGLLSESWRVQSASAIDLPSPDRSAPCTPAPTPRAPAAPSPGSAAACRCCRSAPAKSLPR